jgi:tryptophanyl-tRNA synthetase
LKGKKIPCLIPHGVDQDPHFRLTRDILPKIGHYKPASIQCSFLPPLTGAEGKMNSSGEDTKSILSTDNPEQVKKKINKYAFSGGGVTLEEHKKSGGNVNVDVAFQYLKYMFEEDDSKLEDLEKRYKSGELSTGEMKAYAIEKINNFLSGHQKRRAKVKVDDFILRI